MAQKLTKKRSTKQKVNKQAPKSVKKVAVTQTSFADFKLVGKYTEAIGRRKVATARVRLYDQPGDFVVNGKPAGQYFDEVTGAKSYYLQPLQLADAIGKHGVSVKVSGSGIRGQLGATIHGLSRALVALKPELRAELKSAGLLTRDDRMKESRKIGMGGKARRQRQSPKR